MYFIDAVLEGVRECEVTSSISYAFTRYEDITEDIRDLEIKGDYVILYDLDDIFICNVLFDFVQQGKTGMQLDSFEKTILAEFRFDENIRRYIDLRNGCEY